MPLDRFDLLPPERRRALKRSYIRRLFVAAAILAALLAVAADALLLPTYRYLANAERAKEVQLAALTAAVANAEQGASAKRFTELEADAETLDALGTPPSASAILRSALAVPRPGVTLTSFNYAPATGAKSGALTLVGTAASRDDLRAYQLALSGTAGFAGADLPVSSFAKDSDIPFTITVTLATSSMP